MDTIKLENLIIFAHHGVFDEEQTLGQKFLVSVELGLCTQEAAMRGDLKKTVDYGALAQGITDLFQSTKYTLIETCAEEVAQCILNHNPNVNWVQLTVKKPWAPIGLPLDMVEVSIYRERSRVFVGLGSNVGNKEENLKEALRRLEDDFIEIVKSSTFYETKPWGMEEQDYFLNSVVELRTTYGPMELLRYLQKIEDTMGRDRAHEAKWGPRVIDLDILFFGDRIIYEDDLIIPHPYAEHRDFVMELMVEIAPHFPHPRKRETMEEIWLAMQEEKEE